KRLVDAGVLPNLKFSTQRAADPRPRTSAAPATPPNPPPNMRPQSTPPHEDAGQIAAQDAAALFQGLSELLVEHRQRDPQAPLLGGTRSIASFTPRTAASTYSADELLDALDRLQLQSARDMAQRSRQPQQVERLKADLHGLLEEYSKTPGKQKLSEQEADVIDLVGMLFDFILDDDNLPDICKTVLSHLHTPY